MKFNPKAAKATKSSELPDPAWNGHEHHQDVDEGHQTPLL